MSAATGNREYVRLLEAIQAATEAISGHDDSGRRLATARLGRNRCSPHLGCHRLIPGDEIVASGHASTRVLVNDLFVDEGWHWPWASLSAFGSGHVVVIGAYVSWDYLVDECPDNARWLSNLMTLLVDRSRETTAWRATRPGTETQPAADQAPLLEEEEGQRHERKSSFLTPTDHRRQNVHKKVLQDEVGKSIVALANTDGGNVVIGQDDDGSVLGLEADFESLGRHKNRDGFEQALVQYLANTMRPGWEYIGLRLSWVERDGKSVAIVHVPRCAKPVYLDYGQIKEAVFVRRGSRTDRLEVAPLPSG